MHSTCAHGRLVGSKLHCTAKVVQKSVSKRVGRGAVQEVVAQRTVELLPAEKRPAETKAELSADAQSV